MEKTQVIKCKCGNIFAACRVPECYTDQEWTRDLRDYVLDGCTVDVVDASSFNFDRCMCHKKEEITIANIIPETTENNQNLTS